MQARHAMNAEDVASYLGLSRNTVYQMAKSGTIPSYKVGRKLRFSLDDIDSYIASTRQGIAGMVHAPRGGEALQRGENFSAGLSEAASFGELPGIRFVLAGEDLAADVVCGELSAQGMPVLREARGSYTALVNLYAGDVDMALVNLYDQKSNGYNLSYVRNLAPGSSVIVFRIYSRKAGFIVQAGNPKRLTSWSALLREGVRLANRQKGCGARVLLDEKLCALEARSECIEGYDSTAYTAHSAVLRVAAGIVDVAIGTNRDAELADGTEFVALQDEWVDLVVAKSEKTHQMIRTLKWLLAERHLSRELAACGADDTSKLGSIIYES